ncbi:MAG: hypothetical protein GW858_10120 [Sphingomonadales bacterium]|nr:hypothetical protein [Sphingomonadales bacterium]NCQ21401.1 hypothetical protein [Sphingomonadales bacterium]NCT04188.1 hypothetical protein [Sphingomonadales bacterium]
MTHLPQRFIEDRQMRDAARAVLTDDIERLRASLNEEGIASRVSSGVGSTIADRFRTGARDVLAQAKAQVGDQKGVLAILVGAIILWFSRGPIIAWFDDHAEPENEHDNEYDDDAAPTAAAAQGDNS